MKTKILQKRLWVNANSTSKKDVGYSIYKKSTYFFIFCFLFSVNLNAQTIGGNAPKTGADKDSHGCIASAGYTYSTIKKTCIRLFEQKIQLAEVSPKGSSTANTTVIFSTHKQKAEVFIPNEQGGLLFTKVAAGKWKYKNYTLFQNKGYRLKKGKKIIYQ